MSDLLDRLKTALADRYAIQEELGAGGMATVYLAADLKHHRKVAVKVLRPELTAILGAERFLKEIEVTANLQHPHILPLHDSGEAGGFLYYVMPYVEGESLRDRLNREKQLPLDDAAQITREVAGALTYAHSHDVIHRDIKPENILLSSGGAILADFGIARALDATGADEITASGLVMGTPYYMSPEQATGERRIDGRTDVYSLACVVYEMLGGEPPYTGPTPRAILARQMAGEIRPLALIRTNITPEFDAVLRRALDPTPADRFDTPADFARALVGRRSSRRIRTSLQKVRGVGRQVPLRHVLTAGAALVSVFVIALVFLTTPFAQAREEQASLVVFPFRAIGNETGSLGEGIADLIAATLDGTVGVRVADPTTVWRSLRSAGQDLLRVPELDEALDVAGRVSASTVMLGSVTSAGGRVIVSVRLYDEEGDLRTTLRSSASTDSLGAAVNRLAIDIVAAVWSRDTLPTVPVIETLATDNIDAMKAYLEAKSLSYRGRFQEAQAPIERAVALDSTFALGFLEQFRIRSAVLFENGQPFVGLTEIIDRAMAHRDRLSLRNRLHVEANRALDDTRGVDAAILFGQVLELDSLDLGALRGVAFTYLTYGWQLGKGMDEIEAAYERVVAVDSTDAAAYATLMRLALWTGDDEKLQHHLDRLVAVDSTSPHPRGALGAVRAYRASGPAQDSILRALAMQPIPVVMTVLRNLRTAQPSLAERFFEELMVDSMPVLHQRTGFGARTQLWFGEGRVTANDSLVSAGLLDAIRPTVNTLFVTSLLAGVGDSVATARAVAELASYAPADSLEALLNEKPMVWGTAWAVAGYHATFGDTTQARIWQRALAAIPQGDTPWDWTGSLAADIEARVAVRGGDLEMAEREARRAFDSWTIHSINVGEAHPEPAMRFHLAEVLRARGKINEAEALYRSFGPPHNWAAFYTARSSLVLGDFAERRGDLAEAALRYGYALALWERGDEAVREWRRLAQEALQRVLARIG
ncbi:MAG: protein kinase [Gemmatimonadetes bacterium]|nr:protein kinase [Gemmatimonadota bacterium]